MDIEASKVDIEASKVGIEVPKVDIEKRNTNCKIQEPFYRPATHIV